MDQKIRNDIFELINDGLSKPWSTEEMVFGKQYDVFPEWKEEMPSIVQEYRNVGWLGNLLHCYDGDREFLKFIYTTKKKGKY